MIDIRNFGLLLMPLLLVAGCTGAKISLDHASEDYGQAPPMPQAGGSGPPELGPGFAVPSNEFTIPSRLPELVELYHAKLMEKAHVLPGDLPQQYADKEVASLKRRYAGDEAALRKELVRRLQPRSAHPGPADKVRQNGPVYPTEYQASHDKSGRVQ